MSNLNRCIPRYNTKRNAKKKKEIKTSNIKKDENR